MVRYEKHVGVGRPAVRRRFICGYPSPESNAVPENGKGPCERPGLGYPSCLEGWRKWVEEYENRSVGVLITPHVALHDQPRCSRLEFEGHERLKVPSKETYRLSTSFLLLLYQPEAVFIALIFA